MSFLPVPVDGNTRDWPRKIANAVNRLLRTLEHPFQELAAAPSDPTEGQSYYDLTLHKVRTWDGSAWQNHW